MLFALSLVAGCARPVGDFGRASNSVLHDEVMPGLGAARARMAEEPVSSFNLTDEEREMRDRVWRFLVVPHAHDWFFDVSAEWQRTRLRAPGADLNFSIDRYYEHLKATRYASSRIRYRTVMRDIETDIDTLPATFASICAVMEIDRRRAVALTALDSSEVLDEQVRARRWENRNHIDWFARALDYRYSAYDFALKQLLIETPHEEARDVEGELGNLAVFVKRARRDDFCGTIELGRGDGAAALPSRYTRPLEPDYLK